MPNCIACGAPITKHVQKWRAKKRGYGFCTSKCSQAHVGNLRRQDIRKRLLARIPTHLPPDQCWEYMGRRTVMGYGEIDYRRSGDTRAKPYRAHRLMYEFEVGPIPDGLFVCHSCDNPPCCNPAHLWLGTNEENSYDRHAKGRTKYGPTKRGEDHPMAKMNEDKVRELLKLRGAIHMNDAADKFGITPQQVANIWTRRHWKHVEL